MRTRFRIEGIVQGVGYRYFTLRTALRIGIDGRVANAPDGSVIVEAEGDEHALRLLAAALREGPLGASVQKVTEEDISVVNETGFQVVSYREIGSR